MLYGINSTPSPLTELSALEAERPKNAGIQFTKKFFPHLEKTLRSRPSLESKYSQGDFVRLYLPYKRQKNAFVKSGQNFSTEVFVVTKVLVDQLPVAYKVSDLQNRPVLGNLYAHNLTPAEPAWKDNRVVEKTYDTETDETGNKFYLVSFKGYSPNYRRWLPRLLFDKLKLPLSER